MRRSKGMVWMLLLLVLFVFTVSAEAAEERGSGVGRFFRGIFKFPAKTTQKSVEVATDATVQTAAIGTGEVENVGRAITGDGKAAVGLVTEPVKGATTTTYETTKGAVMAPVEGAQESVK